MNNICPDCGGYIGIANIIWSSSVPPIKFCAGHPAKGEQNLKGWPIIGEPGPSLQILPQDASVYPSNHFQHEETLWKIAQAVAEKDSTYLQDSGEIYCVFCMGQDLEESGIYVHEPSCVVTKARELMEWRNAQPKVFIQVRKDAADIAREIAEKINAIDGEVPRD